MEKKIEKAFALFDAYNSNDIHQDKTDDKLIPKEFLYAVRMTEKLYHYAPDASEAVRLAARCQHIGRWEIPRDSYPMDKKGYLQWRSQLALHHSKIAGDILEECGYDNQLIDNVKFLLQKKQLHQNPDTQLLEDVICLVFIQFYLEEFAQQHEDDKVVDILKKTMKKMSSQALVAAGKISVSNRVKKMIEKAGE